MPMVAAAGLMTAGSLYQGWKAGEAAKDANKIQGAIAEQQVAVSQQQMEIAQEQWDYYLEAYRPKENELIAQAGVDQLETDQRVGRAISDVEQQFSAADEQANRMLMRMGVNPNSGAFIDRATSSALEKAKSKAFTANSTRLQSEADDFAQKAQVVAMGKGYSGEALNGMTSASAGLGSAAGIQGQIAKTNMDNATAMVSGGIQIGGAALASGGDWSKFGTNLMQ